MTDDLGNSTSLSVRDKDIADYEPNAWLTSTNFSSY
jgi:hypothetical protein